MNKTKIKDNVNRFGPYLPPLVVGLLSGAAIGASIVHRTYNPKDMVAIQMPKGVLDNMKSTGKGLALNTNVGWFTLKYHPAA